MTDAILGDLNLNGFVVVPKVLAQDEIEFVLEALLKVHDSDAVRRRGGIYAHRNLLSVPAIAALTTLEKFRSVAELALGPRAFPVRGILFDKTPDANWLVPWHQDLTICVKDRVDLPGYGQWTVKAGVSHVQPPRSVLESMVALRLHLDDCQLANGPLRVLPGTHRSGRLTAEDIGLAKERLTATTCLLNRGDLLVMKLLLLHASSAATLPAHRRVIHIDFASCDLADGLTWYTE